MWLKEIYSSLKNTDYIMFQNWENKIIDTTKHWYDLNSDC